MLRSTEEFELSALDALKSQLANFGLISVDDPIDQREVLDELVHDMSEEDRRRFRRTVRHLAKDPSGGTVASISELPSRYFVVRLRNATLQKLVPVGHALLEAVMAEHGPHGTRDFSLQNCEVRERGTNEGFIYGSWEGGERSFFRFLFSQRRASFIAGLFLIGLALEVSLSFALQTSQWVQLGLRLGAPMLVSSLVLILERRAQFRDQVKPRLRWTTARGTAFEDPFRASPQIAPA